MHAMILCAFLAADPVTLHLAWEGGGPSSPVQDAPVRGTDSPLTSLDSAPETILPSSQGAEFLSVCRCGGDSRKPECLCRFGCQCTSFVSSKPALTIISPASWECAYCPAYRSQDWSEFDVKIERRDGLRAYPCAEWTDRNGVLRRLFGAYTPSQVKWSMDRTNE